MTIGITNHAKIRLEQRFLEFKNYSIHDFKRYLGEMIKQAIIIYFEPTNKTNVYIGSNFKMVISANKHDLITFISI